VKKASKPMIDRYTWYEVVAIYAGIALLMFYMLSPFIEGFMVSLKPLSLLFSSPYTFWPKNGSLTAYWTMWESVPMMGRYIFNSLFISGVVTIIVLILVVPASYAFARFEFPGRGALLGAFLAINMFQGAVLIIPLFRLMRSLGVLNTYFAMIVPGVAFLIPTAIWLLRTYMLRIPRELEEAAWVDGASRLYIFRRIIRPLSGPMRSSSSSRSPSIRRPNTCRCRSACSLISDARKLSGTS
jgi:multiple sugar transport system permease protein